MVEIRLLSKTDWQGLYDIISEVDKELVGMFSETEELVEDWINSIEPGVWEVYVATLPQHEIERELNRLKWKLRFWHRYKRNPNNIVGLVTLYGDWEEDEEIQKGEFDIGITVAKPFQKKGIGKELLHFVCNRGEKLGYLRATLWTRIDNHPMIKLAKKVGFKEGKTRTRFGYQWIQFTKELRKKEEKE